MQSFHFLAFDLGASSGRAILGTLMNDQVGMKEIHRFPNKMILEDGHEKWDIHGLFSEILTGLKLCIEQEQVTPACIGIDTWGVDFGLLDYAGGVAGNPFAYRDAMTVNAIEEVTTRIPAEKLYRLSGIQFLPFNTLFQLWSLKKRYPEKLLSANKLLFMPDLLSYLLTGISYSEYTVASTSQMLDPLTGRWNMKLMHKLGLPTHLLDELVEPGTVIGSIKSGLQAKLGIGPVPVAAVAAHDTASAIVAIPAIQDDWAFLSSGTWSLLGVELDKPCLSQEAYEADFTNEGGVEETTRFLKNINGLWLLQECKRIWDQEKVYSYKELSEGSKSAEPFRSMIDTDHPSFLNPGNMVETIQQYCRENEQAVPETVPEICRTIFESLALKYKVTLDKLVRISGKTVNRIHVIGGGSQNEVLCQYTANATGLQVVAGPAEGTALGNIMMQAKAIGLVSNLSEIRSIVSQTVKTKTYRPKNQIKWQKANEMYLQHLMNKTV